MPTGQHGHHPLHAIEGVFNIGARDGRSRQGSESTHGALENEKPRHAKHEAGLVITSDLCPVAFFLPKAKSSNTGSRVRTKPSSGLHWKVSFLPAMARGCPVRFVAMPGTNHFDIVFGLAERESLLARAVIEGMGLA